MQKIFSKSGTLTIKMRDIEILIRQAISRLQNDNAIIVDDPNFLEEVRKRVEKDIRLGSAPGLYTQAD